jgi:hypothetical protein
VSWWGKKAQQLRLLEQVQAGAVHRGHLCGDLEPYLLDGRPVSAGLFSLTVRGWVLFDPTGAVHVTRRGQRALLRDALESPGLPWEPRVPLDTHPPT